MDEIWKIYSILNLVYKLKMIIEVKNDFDMWFGWAEVYISIGPPYGKLKFTKAFFGNFSHVFLVLY
jgi:hypothetical protein